MAHQKVLMSGNEAIAMAALDAGCGFYAGYPITPQNELIGYMAKHMPLSGGVFIQSESELSAINMVFGASAAGCRAMTSSSSPGISLMQEGISYIAGAELPAVIVNIMRAGPGLGNIWPAQSDYFQAVKGGGHGDYRCITLAPSSVQEAYDLTLSAFELADKYRIPVFILGDGMLGQMMEPLTVSGPGRPETRDQRPETKEWAASGCAGRKPNVVKSFYLNMGDLEKFNLKLQEKYKGIQAKEQLQETAYIDDARVILTAYGTMARIAKSAVEKLREKGKKAGLLRPITLWPFPRKIFNRLAVSDKQLTFLTVEMSYGQMVEDVQLAVEGKARVEFLGRSGGGIPSEEAIINKTLQLLKN
ncbi:3-methyl-2-oxobutanoate dehydrogenase subunit VorB [bacterium]|nr:MAG: 3-methyl-2-oxobutanoate dehydrogenase subunit VorB [bacterium]